MNLSSVASALLVFGIVLALAGAPLAAIISGALGVAFEGYIFYTQGLPE
jgi:hypothetical protein